MISKKEKPAILYVDDELENLTVFKAAFRRDYKVFTAVSAHDGVDILKTKSIKVIITDQRMPEVTGIEFLESVIPEYPESIRMILTGFSDVEAIIQAINKGQIYRYITKPWTKEELKVNIDNAIETYELRKKNKNLISDLRNANQTLEEKVKERTAQLMKSKEELEEKNNKLTASITYARRIQSAMLPADENIVGYLPEFFILFKPRDIVSGDFYWFENIGQKSIIAAVDCTGHGIPGAFMSMMANEILNEIVIARNIIEPDKILNELHKRVRIALRQKESDNSDGMDIAICSIDTVDKIVEFAGAGNPIIYINRDERNIIKGDKKSIGGIQREDERIFTKHTIVYEQPTEFYIYSDGYQDQLGGPERRKFMAVNFQRLLSEIHRESMAEQKKRLEDRFVEWISDQYEQVDDILVIGFRL